MTNEAAAPTLRVSIGCRHDVPAIAELARNRLPAMTYLHDASTWEQAYRFGPGFHARDRYLPVIHAMHPDGREELLAFAWVDAALADDSGLEEPWWCINAVAVTEPYARDGLGSQLVAMIEHQARAAGIVSLYGQAYASAADFWRSCGFSVAELGGILASEKEVPVPDRGLQRVVLNAEPDQHFFVKQVAGTTGVRLRIATYEA